MKKTPNPDRIIDILNTLSASEYTKNIVAEIKNSNKDNKTRGTHGN